MTYLYIIATNTGVGFITQEEKDSFWIEGFLPSLWVIQDCQAGKEWVTKVNGAQTTKNIAQQMVYDEWVKQPDPKPSLPYIP